MITPNPPVPHNVGPVNWLGLWTLIEKEIKRFLKVYFQTILAPVATTLMFLAVFALAMGNAPLMVDGVAFPVFLAPGLIMMAMTQNAFANTSSSLIIAKVQGNIVDVLMPPLSALELTMGYALGGVVRGVGVGVAVWLSMVLFVDLPVHSAAAVVYYAIMSSAMLAFLGMLGGIWADKFDHMAAVTNFVVTPLSFLSGTFYSIDRLPAFLRLAAQFNPFFYMIDGFRYGFIGHLDGNLWVGVAVMAVSNAALAVLCWRMFQTGYKLKA